MSQIRHVVAHVLTLPLLAGCMVPVSVQMPETTAPAVRDVSVGPGPGAHAGQAGAAQQESPAPVFPAARQAPVEQRTITITGRLWDDAPGQVSRSSGYDAYAPRGEFAANRRSERLGVIHAIDPFKLDVPVTANDRSLVVFHNTGGTEGDLYLKSFYVGHDRPIVDLGDVIMGYRIGQTFDGEPGTLRLTFPGGHQETKRTVEVVPMRTIDETGLFTPPMSERMNSFYADGDWNMPIEPKTVAVVETGDEPSVAIKGLDNHRWYAVRVKMDLPNGGQAVTSVNSFLAGRDTSMQISSEWAKCPTCIDLVQRQGTPEEVDAANQAVVEAN